MKRIIINIILISVLVLLAMVIILPFFAEREFRQAKYLEKKHRWQEAQKKFQTAMILNPFDSEYVAAKANLLIDQAASQKNKIQRLKDAEKLYQRAVLLNPEHAEYSYLLAKAQLELKDRNNAFGNFKKAIEKDRYNLRNNYLIGFEMLKFWNFLNEAQKEFTLDRLKFALFREPWYGSSIYPAILYYAKDFNLAWKITPETYRAYRILYSVIEKNNLWRYRKQIKESMDSYRQKEETKEFLREKEEKIKSLTKIREKKEEFVWSGTSEGGKNEYKNGNMYWRGIMHSLISLPEGKSSIKIMAKGEQADNIWPYMIVELDGEEIGEGSVDSPDWKVYSFPVATGGGSKVLSVTFVNDGGNKERNEDRNLYIGEVKIEAGAQ